MAFAHAPHEPTVWHPELLAAALRDRRLTLLVGAPGPLRDGMLRRGLLPLQHGAAQAPVPGLQRVIRFDGWGLLPLPALCRAIDQAFEQPQAEGTLATQLRAIGQRHHVTVLLVLDAFERHLQHPAERPGIVRFDAELIECIADPAVPLHVLMVLDTERPALQRYACIPAAGSQVFYLPSPSVDAVPWSDTDIEAPPPDACIDGPEADVTLDLTLDELPGGAAPPRALPPGLARSPAPPTPQPQPQPQPAEPSRASAPPPERSFASAPMPTPLPAAAAPEPFAPPAPSALVGVAPAALSWRTEPDAHTLRRLQSASRRWPRWLGFALYLAALAGGAWLAARWILDPQRVERPPAVAPRPRAATAQGPVTADSADRSTPATRGTAAAPAATGATASAAAPAIPARATTAALQVAAPSVLTLSIPADAGASATAAGERIRRVAAATGVDVRPAAAGTAAMLTLMRGDALRAARGGAVPLRVVAPLYHEQIQVLVRTDADWDYVHELRGLRLNIGPADGQRAHTARTLYREMFGTPLAPAQADALDLDAALRRLQQRGSGLDAVVAVSDTPVVPQLPAGRRQVRELWLDARRMGSLSALPTFSITRRTPAERPRLSVITYLVATGPTASPHEGALRELAAALCRARAAQPESDAAPRSPSLGAGDPADADWPQVLPHRLAGPCPSP